MSVLFSLARRFRKSRTRSGYLSFISSSSIGGIALGCAVLITALSMMNGFGDVLQHRLLRLVPQVSFEAVDGQLDDWQSLVAVAEQDPQVTAAMPSIEMTAMAQQQQQFYGMQIQGLDPQRANAVMGLSDYVDADTWQRFQQLPNSIIVGAGLAESLNLQAGDTLTLMVAKQGQQAFKAPQRQHLTVAGIFRFGGQIDHQQGYVSLATAQQLAGLGQQVSSIQLAVTDVFAAPSIARRVGNTLPEFVYIKHWMQTQGHLYRDIQLVRSVIYLVLILVMAVACFNIVSTLVMTVQEKRASIAILKTMGLKDRQVRRVFMLQGLLNGCWGTAIGIVAGAILALSLPVLLQWAEQLWGFHVLSDDVYFVSEIPSRWQWQDSLLVAVVALLMSLLATIYPAQRAAKVAPAQALHEKG